MTKHFISSFALIALCTALDGCSSEGPKPSTDPSDVEGDDDGDDSSPDGDDDVEPGAGDVDASKADAGAAKDAQPSANRDASSDDEDDDDDDDSDDDGEDDDDDEPSDAGKADASKADASTRADASTSAPDAATRQDSGTRDSGTPPANNGPLTRTTVNETIVVKSGETFDGTGKLFVANASTLGDGSQEEGQKPVFKLENGAKLVNVTLGAPAADGIHCHGSATLENIVWQDVGEDALTIKEKGTVELRGGSATLASDKIFQINAESTFRVSNFKADGAGKFIRQTGDSTFKVEVVIDKCDISNMKEAIFRTDSSTSTVTMTNTRYSQIGKELFMGVSSGNVRQMNNTEY